MKKPPFPLFMHDLTCDSDSGKLHLHYFSFRDPLTYENTGNEPHPISYHPKDDDEVGRSGSFQRADGWCESAADEIIASPKTARCLRQEYNRQDGCREQNPLHKPYINICKALTSYRAADPARLTIPRNETGELRAPPTLIGYFNFEELHFEVYEGKGGHLPGEIVLIDYEYHLAFTGDIHVNTHGLTPEQAAYNQYAPIRMPSVDTDPKLCAEERKAIIQRLGVGQWQIFGTRGFKKEHTVSV